MEGVPFAAQAKSRKAYRPSTRYAPRTSGRNSRRWFCWRASTGSGDRGFLHSARIPKLYSSSRESATPRVSFLQAIGVCRRVRRAAQLGEAVNKATSKTGKLECFVAVPTVRLAKNCTHNSGGCMSLGNPCLMTKGLCVPYRQSVQRYAGLHYRRTRPRQRQGQRTRRRANSACGQNGPIAIRAVSSHLQQVLHLAPTEMI